MKVCVGCVRVIVSCEQRNDKGVDEKTKKRKRIQIAITQVSLLRGTTIMSALRVHAGQYMNETHIVLNLKLTTRAKVSGSTHEGKHEGARTNMKATLRGQRMFRPTGLYSRTFRSSIRLCSCCISCVPRIHECVRYALDSHMDTKNKTWHTFS